MTPDCDKKSHGVPPRPTYKLCVTLHTHASEEDQPDTYVKTMRSLREVVSSVLPHLPHMCVEPECFDPKATGEDHCAPHVIPF